jgi:hypothetical protein
VHFFPLKGQIHGSRFTATAGTYLGSVPLSASRGLSAHFPEPFVIDTVIGAVFLQFEKGSVDRFTEFAPLGEHEAVVLNVKERTDGLDFSCPFMTFIMEDGR